MSKDLIELEIMRRAAPHLKTLEAGGFEIFAPKDFTQIQELVSQTGRDQQTPMLSIARNDFTLGSAFWLFLMIDGKCVGGCAAHMIDLRDESFEHYLRRTSKEQYQRNEDPIETVAEPISQEIRGRVVYIGELELHPEFRGRLRALTAFTKVMQALIAVKWPDFDWMVAFVPLAHSKLTGLYGFTWQMPYAIRWNKPAPEGRLDSHWLIGLPRTHFNHVWSSDL